VPVIQAYELSKHFELRSRPKGMGFWRGLFAAKETRRVEAVTEVSFSIEKGERVAFIGPNGAGKSTTLKMLSGILHPSSGKAEVAGLTPWAEREKLAYRIGTVFGQRSQLWQHLTVREGLSILGRIYDLPAEALRRRIAELTSAFRLDEFLDRPARALSLGQRMRCEIAASLIHKPDILFLDEPTIGLDLTAKAELRDHLRALSDREGLTFLLTSHDMGDIQEICERVILINRGLKLIDLSLAELRRVYLTHRLVTLVTAEEKPDFTPQGAEIIRRQPYSLTLKVPREEQAMAALIAAATARLKLRDISIEEPPLEDIIKRIYGGFIKKVAS
jgi:ABC-2 type transport system ATP-binding protein